jgi:lysophospholipase L1-like esterase
MIRRCAAVIAVVALVVTTVPLCAAAVPPTAQIYAIGDSITGGTALSFAWQAWPERAANRALGPDHIRMHVIAHGGQCLVATICAYGPPLVRTWPGEVLAASPTPTTILLMIGRNDLAHATVDQMMAAFHELVSSAAEIGAQVIVGTVLPAGAGYAWWDWTEADRRALNDRIRSEFAPDVFDGAASIGDSLYGWYDSGDRIHPAWPAHVVVADTVPLGRIR